MWKNDSPKSLIGIVTNVEADLRVCEGNRKVCGMESGSAAVVRYNARIEDNTHGKCQYRWKSVVSLPSRRLGECDPLTSVGAL